ncbi:glutamate--tRNA ligase [Candidatus Peregrinibacteria bacterium]|nr:glutamate--tRNA ligase [Candidatus Peregrinibacteria bacterium]
MTEKIIVRNCPSPTGLLHIGTLRTALYNYLFAKKHGGEILFRSEDTDKERSKIEYEESILSGLSNLGLPRKESKVIRQSERTEMYKQYLQKLLDEEKAYYCFMTAEELEAEREEQRKNGLPPRYSGKYREYPKEDALKRVEKGERAVIRLKVPKNEEIIFHDLIRGANKTNTKDLFDFVIAKNLETPLYNFVVVIDDHEMQVSHVLRGEDHIPNTPKQILVYQALEWNIPEFAHFPLILNADKSKLSKRKNKVSVNDFLEEGYLPEALLNFLVLLGWNPGTEEEIFSLEEMIEKFSLERVHKAGAVFDLKKLEWLNGMYIRKLDIDNLKSRVEIYLKESSYYEQIIIKGDAYLLLALKSVQEKMKKLSEVAALLQFYYKTPHAEKGLMLNEKMKVDENTAKEAIQSSMAVLSKIDKEHWKQDFIKEELIKIIHEKGWKNGQLLWPLRAALTGEEASPGAFEVAEILEKEESLHRLENTLKIFK